MEFDQDLNNENNQVVFDIPSDFDDLHISIEECKKILHRYHLSDEQILLIKNNLVGIANSVINYLIDEHMQRY